MKSWVNERRLGLLAAGLGLLLGGCRAVGSEPAWTTDLDAARERAAAENRAILVNFSGSDWCGWCIRLDREVFRQEAFQTFAAESLVLVLIDFPRGIPLPEDLAERNQDLARRYGVQGFPTILLMRADGTVVARTGYRRGGAAAYVRHLDALLEGDGEDQP